jgi:hypothetical protein
MLNPAALFGLLLFLASPGAAAPTGDVGPTAFKVTHEKGAVFTDSERALITARCGYGSDWNGRSIRFEDGALVCSDGTRVDDPEVRAMTARAGERIRGRVREALNSARLARATSRRAHEQVHQRMRRLPIEGPQMVAVRHHRLTAHERTRLHTDLARMRVDLRRMRADMQRMRERIRRDVSERLTREGVH